MKINRNTTDIIRILNEELKTDKYKKNNLVLREHQYLVKTFYL